MRALEIFLVRMILVASTALCAEDTTDNDVPGRCKSPLGMEEGKIPDDAITASSSYEMKSVGPQNARIRQEKNGGAWCPKAQISSDIREYLEVDLSVDHLITWTETQGRFGNGQGQEYAESFFLEYWRDSRWHPYKTLRGDRVLRGNSNTYLVVQQKLDLPFVASRVRFVPYSQHPRTVCMRVEIFGCVWEQRVVRYEAPRGEIFGPGGANAEDLSYDGREEGDRLVGGLGQLTDGVIGEDPYRTEWSRSTNWVGWANLDPATILFEFAEARDFENCTVHAANAPERGVQPFSRMRLWFSDDGRSYRTSEPEKAEFVGSGGAAGIAVLSIDLRSRSARFVKLELVPRSEWLLISEVTFHSVPAPGNSSDRSPKLGERLLDGIGDNETELDHDVERPDSSYNESLPGIDTDLTPDAFPVNDSQTYIGLTSGALVLLALLLTATFFLVKLRGRNKVALLQKHTALLCGSPAPGITVNAKELGLSSNPKMIGALSRSRSSMRSRGAVYGECATIGGGGGGGGGGGNNSGNEYEHCSIYEKTYKLFSEENLARSRESEYSADSTAGATGFSSEANLRDERISGRTVPRTPFPAKRHGSVSRTTKSETKVHEGYYAATDILTIKRREQRYAGSTSLFTSLGIDECTRPADPRPDDSFNVQRISRHRLRILDKIGEGSFGFVHLCEAKGIRSPDLGTARNRQIVVVRSLWRGVTDSSKRVFMRDMRALAEIRDGNIARILALVEEEPFGAVFEYGELGDLPSLLRNEREPEDGRPPLDYPRLLNFATQIASAMKYLEALSVPHCDLAARNCVVGKNLAVKVSDHAVYCSKYDGEYYANERCAKVPLRWMAWEAALLGKRSCRADVWSYATTVWEILTRCERLPFSEMTSEQVLENCGRWYNGGSGAIDPKVQPPRVLEQPPSCSRDLYRLMSGCWSKRPEDRPTFREIHLFLERSAGLE